MAKVSKDEVKKLARLSKIALSDQEIEQFQAEIAKILGYIDQLNEIDTDGVVETSQVSGLENVTRKDEIKDYGVDREALLANAPEQEDGYIKVRKVL